jgi:pimeloyl-ACP methyl ester carboxylesterase
MMTLQIREHTFDTGVVTINYAQGPPLGPPLVILHGGSGRWQYYQDVLPDLAVRFSLYAPDFRGHGRSGRVPGRYRFQDYADDTVAFLRRCVAEPAFLFGHSLGGMIALMVTAQAPDVVRALVVGDSPLTRPRFGRNRRKNEAWRDLAGGKLSIKEIAEALKDTPTRVPGQDQEVTMRERYGEGADVFLHLATRLYHIDPDTLTALIDDLENTTVGYEMEAVLPGIRCPVLLLQADPDAGGLMKDADVARALPLLARGRRVRLEGIGHALFHPRKGPAVCAITDLFDSVAALQATGDRRVEDILCGAIGVFETAFPDRVRGYYMMGSYHDGDAVPESDLDVIAVFKGEFEPGEEAAGRDLNAYYSRISPVRLDFQPRCETQVFENGDRDLKLGGWLLYGVDIRDAVQLKPLPDPVFAIRSLIWDRIQPLRGWPDVLVYPLAYPDPDDEFYGYTRLGIRLPDGDYAPGTRSLVGTVTMAAMVLAQLRKPCYIGSKRQAIEWHNQT